ncbi:hypothetical protein ASD11_14220 [Aeromicrobium sp. Root495]|uniref:hypothetical protein n=1 Tax=Aeromicrobium sp. Root495 TaxID=1736550 RepID=UPI00070140DA|nr:hypothetical protein [Aeromicrobium sp. Root495]KQY55667.1 hypothetical protein ASD11_14220 [Aeromicrobium sp. Root495]
MVDIATVSVISSAAVAGITVASNLLASERQRSHETRLDFEKRVWQLKSETLFVAIKESRSLLAYEDTVVAEERATSAVHLSELLDRLTDVSPSIDAYASSESREALDRVIEALQDAGIMEGIGQRVRHYSKLVREAPSGIENFPTLQRRIQWQEDATNAASEGFTGAMVTVKQYADELLACARRSIREPRD